MPDLLTTPTPSSTPSPTNQASQPKKWLEEIPWLKVIGWSGMIICVLIIVSKVGVLKNGTSEQWQHLLYTAVFGYAFYSLSKGDRPNIGGIFVAVIAIAVVFVFIGKPPAELLPEKRPQTQQQTKIIQKGSWEGTIGHNGIWAPNTTFEAGQLVTITVYGHEVLWDGYNRIIKPNHPQKVKIETFGTPLFKGAPGSAIRIETSSDG